ncbi:DUF6082 family protein [Microbispora sp. CA-135349]|uniref:DUF6082 family protein n=1 Tax=Microbispora sp. CA-135349 TaxID=3239953 RepID=UPI003D932350
MASLDTSWPLLAEVGQTYDAAAALLTALALLGVVGSLIMQAREMHIARMEGHRANHMELLRMAIDDPVYQRAWATSLPEFTQDHIRQHLYINLVMSFWSINFDLGTIFDSELQYQASALFQGEAGRRYWEVARLIRQREARGRQRRFVQIVDDEYRKAIDAGPAAISADAPASTPASGTLVSPDRARLFGIALGAAALIAAGAVTEHLLHNRTSRLR